MARISKVDPSPRLHLVQQNWSQEEIIKFQPMLRILTDLFRSHASAINALTDGQLDYAQLGVRTIVPQTPSEGMVAFADGVTWNPGNGRGLYYYSSAAWHFLGATTVNATVWQQIAVHDTVGAAESSFTWSGLDGDTDIEYMIIGRWIAPNPAADDVIAVQPNADGTAGNYNNEHISGVNATAPVSGKNAGNQPGMFMSEVFDNNDISAFTATLFAKTGQNRVLVSTGGDAMGSNYITGIFNATWLNTATNISSLKVVSMFGGSDIGIGSHFELWSLRTIKVVQ